MRIKGRRGFSVAAVAQQIAELDRRLLNSFGLPAGRRRSLRAEASSGAGVEVCGRSGLDCC